MRHNHAVYPARGTFFLFGFGPLGGYGVKMRYWGLVLVAGLLFGCTGGDTKTDAPAPGGGKAADKPLVGIVFDSGGKGDKSFKDSADAGIQRAIKDLNIEEKSVDSKTEKDYEANLTGLAEKGCKVIFAVGFAQKTALTTVAPKYPDIKFGLI